MGLDESIGSLHYVPIITSFLLSGTFILTYTIAVSLGHIPAVFPFISDTGTFPPESCIFAQVMNIAAALLCVTIYIRYSQTKELFNSYKLTTSLSRYNTIGAVLGLMTSLGLSVVANFQETTAVIIHAIGTTVCIGCGTAYFWVQVWISYEIHCSGWSLVIAHLRLCLALMNTTFKIITVVTMFISSQLFEGEDTTQWIKEHGGWEWHVISTISEWLCAACFALYILTFAYDFRSIRITRVKVIRQFRYEFNHRKDVPRTNSSTNGTTFPHYMIRQL